MKITFDLAVNRISVDGEGKELLAVLEKVREIAPSLKHIEINAPVQRGVPHDQRGKSGKTEQNGYSMQTLASGQTLKQFVRSLRLDSLGERITAIGYYKKMFENVETFSPKEMANWFGVCGFQKPAQMPVAIFNASKNNDYVASIGHGQWRLTTNGENLIIGKQNELENSEE